MVPSEIEFVSDEAHNPLYARIFGCASMYSNFFFSTILDPGYHIIFSYAYGLATPSGSTMRTRTLDARTVKMALGAYERMVQLSLPLLCLRRVRELREPLDP
jgi:hypothetical protein